MPRLLVAILLLSKPSATIVLGGDLMLNRAVPNARPLSEMKLALRSADAAFANLEIPLTKERATTTRKSASELAKKDQWILKASPSHARFLRDNGIQVVSLGNNHCMDYGSEGLAEMTRALDLAGIAYAGAGRTAQKASSVSVFCTPSGVRIGLLSAMAFMTVPALRKTTPATRTTPGVAVLSFSGYLGKAAKEKLDRWISNARRKCDYLVVGVHWGVERKTVPNAYQVALGRALADAGADVVWGHHPHVLQGMEIYRGVPILYSMGNLVSSLPSDTGLVRLSLGPRRKLAFLPARVSSNHCSPLTGPAATAAKARFLGLCRSIQTKYPSPMSCLPSLQ